MIQFIIECPKCYRYVEVEKRFFTPKKVDCVCGHAIQVKTARLPTRTYSDCDSKVVFDQVLERLAKEEEEKRQIAFEVAEREARKQQIRAARARWRKRFSKILVVLLILAAAVFAVTSVISRNQKYDQAVALMNEGKYADAYDTFIALGGHKDSADKAASIKEEAIADRRANAKVGDYIILGAYEQDNDTSNGKEEIEWLVLAREDNRILVISRYALDCKPYNETRTDMTWETCTLRKWLNDDFLNAAFSSTEQALIPTVTVSADENPTFSTNPGNATQDQVFLLSVLEMKKYITSRSDGQCTPTAYAKAQGAYANKRDFCWWWLRSPGSTQDHAAHASTLGVVYVSGYYVSYAEDAVRPALWISVEP